MRGREAVEAEVVRLLVVQHDVRPPDVIGGNVEHVHAAVLIRVPPHLVVVPELLHPEVGGHNLVP